MEPGVHILQQKIVYLSRSFLDLAHMISYTTTVYHRDVLLCIPF